MSTLRISLFGRFYVQQSADALTALSARKVQELFCYLLLYRNRIHPRETVADLLWSGYPTDRSKKYLRQTLWQLQTALDASGQKGILQVDSECIEVNPNAEIWLDIAEFEQTYALVKGIPGSQLSAEAVGQLQEIVRLYQGDLLEGWYQDWCLYERERFQNMYLAVLDKLMDFCEAHRDYKAGIFYGECILRHDRAHERTHQRLIHLHALSGDRTAALRQYQRCVLARPEALGGKPARGTVELYECFGVDQAEPLPVPASHLLAPRLATLSAPQMLDQIRELQVALTSLQTQLQQVISGT